MRYTITNQHVNYYIEHGFIEFEEIINPKLLEDAKEKLPFVTNTASALELYKTGRDLFRENTFFEKIAKNPNIAQIAKILTKAKKLQLAFDQIYVPCNIFQTNGAFEEYFSFQSLSCIAIVKLDDTSLDHTDNFQPPTQFSNVVFVNPNDQFDLSSLQIANQCLFFIGYGTERTIYIHNPKDLNNAELKNSGYSFGDPLKQDFHPIVA